MKEGIIRQYNVVLTGLDLLHLSWKELKQKNKNSVCVNKKYKRVSDKQICYLTKDEVEKYIKERKSPGIK
jgi:hypothetical protein